jgi:hypothetical protein
MHDLVIGLFVNRYAFGRAVPSFRGVGSFKPGQSMFNVSSDLRCLATSSENFY